MVRATAVIERVVWLLGVLASLWLMAGGLYKTVYFEPTGDALREAAVGLHHIRLASVALLALGAYAGVRGAPWWCWAVVLAAPVLCGGLSEVWGGSLFPQLAFLLCGPLAGLAGVVGALVRWGPPA